MSPTSPIRSQLRGALLALASSLSAASCFVSSDDPVRACHNIFHECSDTTRDACPVGYGDLEGHIWEDDKTCSELNLPPYPVGSYFGRCYEDNTCDAGLECARGHCFGKGSGPVCGDGVCSPGETCSVDCGAPVYCDQPISPVGVQLPVVPLAQACSEWCWATTMTMVATYYGIAASECGIVSAVDHVNCCNPFACDSACNHPGPPDLLGALGIYGEHLLRGLSEPEMQRELSNGRPFIVAFLGPAVNHVVVVSGFLAANAQHPALYHLIDPLNWSNPWVTYVEPFVADLSYDQLAHGPDGQSVWSGTFLHLSPRPDGCSPPFNPTCACKQ